MTQDITLNRARELYAQSQFQDALAILRPLFASPKAAAEVLHLGGVISMKLQDFGESLRLLQRACRLTQESEVWKDLAVACLQINAVDTALAAIQVAMKRDSQNESVLQACIAIEEKYAEQTSLVTQKHRRTAYRYSIIIPHYDGSISDNLLLRTLDSLQAQTERQFEVLLYHDGHLTRSLPSFERFQFPITVNITSQRHNDWGHTQRDMGIRASSGDYILHMNADNVLYPNALEEIERLTKPESYPQAEQWSVPADLIVFPIYQIGWACDGRKLARFVGKGTEYRVIMTGFPACRGFIDAMQLVMTRAKWLSYGGWYDRTADSDGKMYQRFIQENGARYSDKILGEHW